MLNYVLKKYIYNVLFLLYFSDIPGMIITLNVNGQIEICYLGTNIYSTPIQQPDTNKDYKEMEIEMKDLTEQINKYTKSIDF